MTYPDAVNHEFILRATTTPGGASEILLLTRLNRGLAVVDRARASGGSFTESAVAGILASLTDAFMRELVITDIVRLAPIDALD